MSQQPIRRTERFTYGDYLTWPPEERWELIDGVPYDMTPAPSTTHQVVVGELFFQLRSWFAGHPCRVFMAPFDVRLPEGEERDDAVRTVVQPDLAVICDAGKIDERGCRGVPDLVMEVLSPATALRDQVEKLALYERHGVREYWMVHPTDRIVTVLTLLKSGRFAQPRLVAASGSVAVDLFPGLEINFDAVFAAVRQT